MKQLEFVMSSQTEVLNFLKSRFPMYHQSNFFFRDVQYGIEAFLEDRGVRVSYSEAEKIARQFVQQLEKERIFLPIDRQSWAVNYPEFKKPVIKTPAPAKPAAAAPAVPGTSAPKAGPKPPSAPAATGEPRVDQSPEHRS